MSHDDQKINAFEATLFIYGEPMSFKKAAGLLGVKPGEVGELVSALSGKLQDRGLSLVVNDDSVQLTTKPEFGNMIETIAKEELSEELSPASLETLAIIAYLGPMPRSKVDYIRGVNSSYIIRSLSLRGLLEREPDPRRGNIFLYNVSFDLLRHLGLQNKEELPEFTKYAAMLTKVGKEGELAAPAVPLEGPAAEPGVENSTGGAEGSDLE